MDGDGPTGGSAALSELIDKYGEVLVPDLLHYYGVDIRDLFRDEDPLSPRYVLTLVIHLPIESAFFAARRGGQEYRGWGPDTYAAADIATSLRTLNHLYVSAHIDRKKHRMPAPPKPYPTPETLKAQKQSKRPGSFAQVVINAKAASIKRKAGR